MNKCACASHVAYLSLGMVAALFSPAGMARPNEWATPSLAIQTCSVSQKKQLQNILHILLDVLA